MIEIESRVVHVLGVTANPDQRWVTQVARNFCAKLQEAGQRFLFCIRDRDTKFTVSFDAVLASIGIQAIKTPVRSPRANAFAERSVRTVREDCLDHLAVFSRRHLEKILGEYVKHCNEARPHRGLQLAPPVPRSITTLGTKVIGTDVLDGLIHEYELAALSFDPPVASSPTAATSTTTPSPP